MARREQAITGNGMLAFVAAVALLLLVDEAKTSPMTPMGKDWLATSNGGEQFRPSRVEIERPSSDAPANSGWRRRITPSPSTTQRDGDQQPAWMDRREPSKSLMPLPTDDSNTDFSRQFAWGRATAQPRLTDF